MFVTDYSVLAAIVLLGLYTTGRAVSVLCSSLRKYCDVTMTTASLSERGFSSPLLSSGTCSMYVVDAVYH